MNANGEFTKDDLAVDRDMEIDCDIGQEILVYFECWFDADRKFSIDTSENDAWYHQSPMEFCESAFDDSIEIGGI